MTIVPSAKKLVGRVALIASDRPGERIAASLRTQGVEIAAYGSLDDLPGEMADHDLTAIVVWVQDHASAPAELIEPLTRRCPQTPIVLVCVDIPRWAVRAALAAGAAGVVLFDGLDTALTPCLQAVAAGQTCVPRGHWRQIEPPPLSSREKQILGLVVMGHTNSQIAARLFLAESTVKSHLSSAFGKLGVRSRNEAAGVILDPERGLGMGILALGGEPVERIPTPAQ